MSFSPDWLALRGAADVRARNRALQSDLVAAVPDGPLSILDLGTGSGANLAALSPVLPRPQHWTLVDNDRRLMDMVELPGGVVVEKKVADLMTGAPDLFHAAPDLVTASAFFDLCGPDVLNRIVEGTVATQAVFYTVLTYDGRENWVPAHPLDAEVLAAFHADQRRDKGLGPALGPDATEYLASAFKAAGYRVHQGASDWVLKRDRDGALIQAMARGSGEAVAGTLGPRAAEWAESRAQAEDVLIGHQDLLAVPPA